MNSLFDLIDYFAGLYREADKSRKGMADISKWWLENVRNLAVLTALGYAAQKTDNIIIEMIFQISLVAYTFYFLYPMIIIVDVLFPLFASGKRWWVNLFRFLQWSFVFFGMFSFTGTLIKIIVKEVAKAQHP